MEHKELKPCPFCGGAPFYHTFDPYDGYHGNCVQHNVKCTKCSVVMVGVSEKNAKENWNRRVNDRTIPNEWISVYSNEKPKDRREYFVAYVFGDSDMHFYGTERYHAFEGNGIVNRPHFSNEGVHEMRVTHWMPIPQLPKNEENRNDTV